jgi:sortase A
LRVVLRFLGPTLIALGVVGLLFVGYEVWLSNWFVERANHQVRTALEQRWRTGRDPLLPLPNGALPRLPEGKGIANLYVPRFGRDYAWTIVEGTSGVDLDKGPGHYSGTALPGRVGNFGVAGHRVGKGEPFLNLDRLRPGDAVIVQTESDWFTYRVKGERRTGDLTARNADGIPGREVVSPSDRDVLLPVPGHPGRQPTERLMTLTTCHPKFTASERMVVFAKLAGAPVPSTGATMPAPVAALYERKSR